MEELKELSQQKLEEVEKEVLPPPFFFSTSVVSDPEILKDTSGKDLGLCMSSCT